MTRWVLALSLAVTSLTALALERAVDAAPQECVPLPSAIPSHAAAPSRNPRACHADTTAPTIRAEPTVYPTYPGSTCYSPEGIPMADCGVVAVNLMPSNAPAQTFTGMAFDDVGVTAVQSAVTDSSGASVVGYTPCSLGFAFPGFPVPFSCEVSLPVAPTPQAGKPFNILVRGVDAAGNAGDVADPATGSYAASANEKCTFFTRSDLSLSTGDCAWVYDNAAPYIVSASATKTGATMTAGDVVRLTFPEAMRPASMTTPQSITVSDGDDAATYTNGINALFTRICNDGATAPCTASDVSAWDVLLEQTSFVEYPATITALFNFRDLAGNSASLATGDTTID